MADVSRKIDAQPAAEEDAAPALLPRRPRRRTRRGWLLLPVLIAIGAAGWYGWNQYKGETTVASVVTETPVRGTIENSVTASGLLSPVKDVDVGAQVSGQLKSLKVEIGDTVRQGQLIAEMDSASIETQIEIAEAELANLEAQMLDKKAQVVLGAANLTRQQNLVASNGAAQSALDEAVANLATAEANVAALEAQIRKQEATLKDARISLGYTKIYAPMAGTIVETSAKEGQTLNANQSTPTIVTVADLSTMTVEAEVSEADVGKLRVGMDAYFTLLGQPGKHYEGKLRQIKPTPSTENNVVLYYALFDVPNPEGTLMMNMTAQVFFVQARAEDVLTVPVAAVHTGSDGKSSEVTVVTGSGAQETRVVETGVKSRVRVEIKSGLEENDRVVVGAGSGDGGTKNRSANRRGMGGMPPPMF
ncbi:macrolide-specific efflux system membrane fusion protein [Pararhizobium capsulatum DSM 1112]|uniref:Macrolide-specific efflux system membrane fusion protein n=1 Tax=Pararhizobium capsulatum DSM 1112 TaxID=1121113 RepID=A0ABU0BK07_9HYPH|nr:efflux RND transporter periplasmic adaptor subunit [Pararhizobium capsulatum]MDQ0318573.1 macrolide-specific efflux system membrane fusion protein [Pararhizobium capsulatum DSM 1112]